MILREIAKSKLTREVLIKSNDLNGEQSRGFRLQLPAGINAFDREDGPGLKVSYNPVKTVAGEYHKAAMRIQTIKIDPEGDFDIFISFDIAKSLDLPNSKMWLPLIPPGKSDSTTNAIFVRFDHILEHATLLSTKMPSVKKASDKAKLAGLRYLESSFKAGPEKYHSYKINVEHYKDGAAGYCYHELPRDTVVEMLKADGLDPDPYSHLSQQIVDRFKFAEIELKKLVFDHPDIAEKWNAPPIRKRPA